MIIKITKWKSYGLPEFLFPAMSLVPSDHLGFNEGLMVLAVDQMSTHTRLQTNNGFKHSRTNLESTHEQKVLRCNINLTIYFYFSA